MLKDFFGKDASVLKNKKLWLFDMDGTIYEENKLFDGTIHLLNRIVENGGKYVNFLWMVCLVFMECLIL